MGFRLVQKSVTLNDLELRNDRRHALSLRCLSFWSTMENVHLDPGLSQFIYLRESSYADFTSAG